ncbi:MAG: hypothetical protein IJL14_06070 [Selenomonadaceae bacterium]|nr:hypothetical protein [Selenomonadaceae bacterium]
MIPFVFDLQRFAFSGGNGTKDNPYRISSQADLEQLAKDVNGGDFGGSNSYHGKYFKLTNDIALTGNFTTIGARREISFHGNFDGDNHTISNLTINQTQGFSYASGFFGYVYGSKISNLHFTNVNINSNAVNVGAIVGDTDGPAGDDANISNCSVQGTVTGTGGTVGGLVGNNYGFINNSAFFGTINYSGGNVGIMAGNTAFAGFINNNYYVGDFGNINTNGATRIYNITVPNGVTSDSLVTFGNKTYIKSGEATFNYPGGTYKYNVTGDVTVTFKDNKFYANNTDLGAVFPATLEGDGSADNPYLINSADRLRQLAAYVNIGNDCAGKHFKLANDIALTGEWTPIGTSSNNSFMGNFDGDGKIISGLTITDGDRCQGLFGYVYDATIKNVNLTNVNITAKDAVGALVGYASDKTQVGTQIINCSAQGNVKTTSPNSNVGGLVGYINSNVTIDGCSFRGKVQGRGRYEDSRNATNGGGIVGFNNRSTIKNSVFLGDTIISTNEDVIACNEGGTFTDNYYYGNLRYDNANGAIGIYKVTLPEGVTSSSIVTVGGMKFIKGGEVSFQYGGNSYSYTVTNDFAVTIKDNALSFDTTAFNANFPGNLSGSGSANNPYLIKTETDLRQLANYVNYGNDCAGKYFKLADNITLTNDWLAIGENLRPFKGIFDGDGKTISGLTVSGGDNLGLFGRVENATIQNLNLAGVNVTGKNNVGSLVGSANNNSQIINCTVQGNITGSENVGGFVGVLSGSTIKNCTFLGGSIKGKNIGVIVGSNGGSVNDNYYFGDLKGINSNGATQIFNVTMPADVTSTALIDINGTKYIKGGNAIFSYNGKNYSYNVNDDITVTLKDNKVYVNNTVPTMNFPGNLEGDGSANNPFLLKTLDHLRQLANYVNAGNNCQGINFKLTEDIRFAGDWTPIGEKFTPFKGNFDGDNHTISSFNFHRADHFGLFGYLEGASIKNLKLTDVNIRGWFKVGAMAIAADHGTQILNCTASGTVTSPFMGAFIGGVVGYIRGGSTVDGCTFSGTIAGSDEFLGSFAGGISGYNNNSTIKNCANLGGTIKGANYGIIAGNDSSGTFTDNYYLGTLAAGIISNNAAQIYNVTMPNGVTSNALVEIGGRKYIKGGDATFTYNGTDYTYTVTGDIAVTIQDDKLSFGKFESDENFLSTLEGDGSASNPYLIKTSDHMRQLASHVNGGNNYSGINFKLANDINLAGEWTPIGTSSGKFSGNFDGDGHTISGLTISGDDNQGLFGYLDGATLKNVHLTGASITGKNNVGGIVGNANNSQISGCSVQGNITGSGNVGIIVGSNGTLTNNYYFGDFGNINTNGATRIYNITLPNGVTSDSFVQINGKTYIKGGAVTFSYSNDTYNYTVNSDITVNIKDNKFYINDTDLGAVFPATLEGNGSADNPYLIKTAEQLRQLAAYVNIGNNCAGMNFRLTDNITIAGNWTPIGNRSNKFSGIFDGANHTISRITINDATNYYQGLFGYTAGATIQNVNLTGASITGKNEVGMLVGYASDKTQISNCSAQGNVKANDDNRTAGGIVGTNNVSTIRNCTFLGGTIDGGRSGVIAGYKRGSLVDNYYLGDLNGVESNKATQLFNVTMPENVTSSALVEVNGTKYIKAGNATFTYNGKNYSYNVTGNVTVTLRGNEFYVNGTATETTFPATLDGDGSANNPFLIKTEENLRQLANYVNAGNSCQGLTFKIANDIALTSDWTPIGDSSNKFSGTFDGDNHTISNLTIIGGDSEKYQGLFGEVEAATLRNVKLTGVNISGYYRVGALVADAYNNAQILNCTASGDIKSNVMIAFIGGLIGYIHKDVTVDGCSFSGTIGGFECPKFPDIAAQSGGIVGLNDGSIIKNCAYLGGSIKGGNCGAITSAARMGGTLTDNYYLGTLAEGVNNNNATQIFNVTMPESVTSDSIVTFNGTKYIKGGNNTVEGQKLYADDSGSTLTGGLGNDSLWGGAGKDTFIYNGGNDIIYNFGTGDTLITNGFNDIIANYNTEGNYINIPCGAGSVTLKDFSTNEFAINRDTWTLSSNTLTKN